MIYVHNLKSEIREALHERGHTDAQISGMSVNEAFREWCEWHGFLGWAGTIREALDNLREATK